MCGFGVGVSALSLLGNLAFASGESSGGGNAVVCFLHRSSVTEIRQNNGWIPDELFQDMASVELLDVYQARLVKGGVIGGSGGDSGVAGQIIPMLPGESKHEYLQRIISKVNEAYSALGTWIRRGEANLADQIAAPHGLNAIRDYPHFVAVDQSNCVIATVIAQYTDLGHSYIQYDSRFFALPDAIFSAESKAISVLHEYVYYDFRIRGHSTADATRMIVEKIISVGTTLREVMDATKTAMNRSDNIVDNFINSMIADISKVNPWNTIYYRLFESDESFNARCEALAPPINQAAMNLYETKWKSKLLALPLIPTEKKNLIDKNITKLLNFQSTKSDATTTNAHVVIIRKCKVGKVTDKSSWDYEGLFDFPFDFSASATPN